MRSSWTLKHQHDPSLIPNPSAQTLTVSREGAPQSQAGSCSESTGAFNRCQAGQGMRGPLTWKSPWWWTTPSCVCSRESREYSVCSSILPCLSSWLSIPCSPLSSRVRICRKAYEEKEQCFPLPRRTAGQGKRVHFCCAWSDLTRAHMTAACLDSL